MKKLLSLILAVYMSVMCCGMFVACGNVDVPTGGEKPNGDTAVTYYAYDAETDEYDDVNYITLKGDAATWHGIDVSLGEVDFTGTVFYAGDEFTITVSGEFSAMDKCLMTYRGKKEGSGVLKVSSTVITKYSELVNPAVTTDTTVRYFCKKGSKPANPVLPTEPKPDDKLDGTYYEYDPQTNSYDETGYYVIDGNACSIVMDIDGEPITFTGTFTVTDGQFVMECSTKIMNVLEMRVVNNGVVEKSGVLHVTRTQMYSDVTGDITETTSAYFCKKGETPDGVVIPEPAVVTFDGNGGTFDGKATIEVKSGDNGLVTLPKAPTRTGFVFNGYNLKSTGAGESIDKNTPFTDDTTVYAMWAKEVTVTFVSDGHILETKKVGQGMELGKTPQLSDTESAMFIGWFDKDKQYNSYSKVDGDLTLYAEWLTQADIDEYNKSMWEWTKPNHLYIHYLRHDHNVSEEGMTNYDAAPYYATPILSATYLDWALWAWPRAGDNYGRAFYPMHIDMSGAVYDIDLTFTFTDCGWDPKNKMPLNISNVFDTQQIGMQLFQDSSRYGDSGFWANDGGDNYITQSFIQGQHVFVVQGSVSSRHMSSRMILNVAYNPYG